MGILRVARIDGDDDGVVAKAEPVTMTDAERIKALESERDELRQLIAALLFIGVPNGMWLMVPVPAPEFKRAMVIAGEVKLHGR